MPQKSLYKKINDYWSGDCESLQRAREKQFYEEANSGKVGTKPKSKAKSNLRTSHKHKKLHILVCGGRHFDDYDLLEKIIDDVVSQSGCNDIEIISGHCAGADRLGELYAERHNALSKIFPAEWKKYGKCAGPIRNKQMIDYISEFEHKIVIAFTSANTKGTKNTIALAKKTNIPIIEMEYNISNKPKNFS